MFYYNKQAGNLWKKLSRGHRCKQAPCYVAQFTLQSRMPTSDNTYKQFTGLLQVSLLAGDDEPRTSSMDINQLNSMYQVSYLRQPWGSAKLIFTKLTNRGHSL